MTLISSLLGFILGIGIFSIPWYPFVRQQFPSFNHKIFVYGINLLFAMCSTSIISHFYLLFGIYNWQFVALSNFLIALLLFYFFKNSKQWIFQDIKLSKNWHKWALVISLISVISRIIEVFVNNVPKSFDTYIHIRIISRILEQVRPLESSLFYPLGMHGWIVSWSTFGDWREVILLSPIIGVLLWTIFSWLLVSRLNLPDIYKVSLILILHFLPLNPIAQHLAWSELPIPRIFVYGIFFFLLTLVLVPIKNRGSAISPSILMLGTIFIHNLSALNFSLFIIVLLLSKICQDFDSRNFFTGLKSEAVMITILLLTPLLVATVALHSNGVKFDPEPEQSSIDDTGIEINLQDDYSDILVVGDGDYYELDESMNTSLSEVHNVARIKFDLINIGRSASSSQLNLICNSPETLEIRSGKSSYTGTIDLLCIATNPTQNMTVEFSTIAYNDVYDAEGLPPQARLGLNENMVFYIVEGHSQMISIPVSATSLPADGSWSLRLSWGIDETNITISTGPYNSDVISDKSSLQIIIGFLSVKPNYDFLDDNLWWIIIFSLMLIYVAFFSNSESEIRAIAFSGIVMNFCLVSGWLSYPAEWGVVRLAHMQVIPMSIVMVICAWDIYELIMNNIPQKYDKKEVFAMIFISISVILGGHTPYQATVSDAVWDGALEADHGHYYVSENEGWLNYVNPGNVKFNSTLLIPPIR